MARVSLACVALLLVTHPARASDPRYQKYYDRPEVDEPAPASYGILGPLITVAGGAGLIAGVSVAAWALGHPRCGDDANCEWQIPMSTGAGIGAAVVSAGGGLSVGLWMWSRSLTPSPVLVRRTSEDEDEEEEEGPMASPALLATGIGLIAVGGGGLFGGLALNILPNNTNANGTTSGTAHPAGSIIMVSGATALAFGVPMLVLGGRRTAPTSPHVWPVMGLGTLGVEGCF